MLSVFLGNPSSIVQSNTHLARPYIRFGILSSQHVNGLNTWRLARFEMDGIDVTNRLTCSPLLTFADLIPFRGSSS